VDISTLMFGGKKHPWVDLKINGGNCEPPLKVVVNTVFFTVCGRSHLKKPLIRKMSALDNPLDPPECGRLLWMAPNTED